jgi:predicted RNA-binding Zn-ribbon protein involved in translation (DUF1610 family)
MNASTIFELPSAEMSRNTRRNVICPCCNASFKLGTVKRTWSSFICPECGEVLEYEPGTFAYVLSVFCLYGVPALLYYIGYRSLSLIPLSIAVALVIFFLGAAMRSIMFPPKAQQKLNYGDSGLHLTDKPKVREDQRPTDD